MAAEDPNSRLPETMTSEELRAHVRQLQLENINLITQNNELKSKLAQQVGDTVTLEKRLEEMRLQIKTFSELITTQENEIAALESSQNSASCLETSLFNDISQNIAIVESLDRLLKLLIDTNRELPESIKTEFESLRQQIEFIIRNNLLLEQERDRLIEITASKDKFFAIIAHDLRSPLTGLLSGFELLNDRS